MIDPKLFDDFARRVADAMPPGLRQLQTDAEKNLRAVLQSAFSKMNLVTREEFDVQQAVLARTRAKLDEMERRVAALEARVLASTAASTSTDGGETRQF